MITLPRKPHDVVCGTKRQRDERHPDQVLVMGHLQSNKTGLAGTGPTWSEAVMMEEAVDTEPLHARTRRLKKITN